MPKGIYNHKVSRRSIEAMMVANRNRDYSLTSFWKGDEISYNALHKWVNYRLRKSGVCSICGEKKKTDWASKSKKAKRDLNDYIELCRKCHVKYDDSHKKQWETRRGK